MRSSCRSESPHIIATGVYPCGSSLMTSQNCRERKGQLVVMTLAKPALW